MVRGVRRRKREGRRAFPPPTGVAEQGNDFQPAINTPPVKPLGNAKNELSDCDVNASVWPVCGLPPRPAAVRIAGRPLLPTAPLKPTRVPPLKPDGNAKKLFSKA